MSTETFVYLDYNADLIGVFVSDDSTLQADDLTVVTYGHSTGNTATQDEAMLVSNAAYTSDVTLTIDGVQVDGTIYWIEFSDVSDNPKSGLALFDTSGSTPSLIQAVAYGANTKITLDAPNSNFDVPSGSVEELGNVGNPYTFGLNLGVPAPCFTRGVLIATPEGERQIEDLEAGDVILTRDGVATIRWIGSARIAPAQLSAHQHLRPVRIEAGALGGGLPRRPLLVSPRHALLLSDWRAELLFDAPEAIVEAIALIDDRGVRQVAPEDGVEYFQILCDRHELIYAEGALAESFFLCEDSAQELRSGARAEIAALFPELLEAGGAPHVEAALRVGPEACAALRAI